MSDVWELDIPRPEKFVLIAMADHADHDGNNVYPSAPRIAWKTGYDERQVRRIIDGLEALNILVPVKKENGKASVYCIRTAHVNKKPYNAPSESERLYRNSRFGIMMACISLEGNRCHYCGIMLGEAELPAANMPTLDHKVSTKNGGTHTVENLVVCCSECNSEKGANTTYADFVSLKAPVKMSGVNNPCQNVRGQQPLTFTTDTPDILTGEPLTFTTDTPDILTGITVLTVSETSIEPSTVAALPPPRGKFVPPTLEECRSYFVEKEWPTAWADTFWGYWESVSWKRQGKPMTKWKAAAFQWASKEQDRPQQAGIRPAPLSARETADAFARQIRQVTGEAE